MAKNNKTRFFYVLYSDKTRVFDQSERAYYSIYIIIYNNPRGRKIIQDAKTAWAQQGQTTTPGTPCSTLFEQCVGSLTFRRIVNNKQFRDGAYGLSSLSEKTRKSNHLQL